MLARSITEQRYKEMTFDTIEHITIENQTTEFPKHFHETFCFSLIYKGVNQIDFEKQSIYSEAGCISIVNPYEIHSNPLIDCEPHIKFDTIYVPQKVMQHVLNGKNIRFVNRKVTNKKANRLFLKLKSVLDTKDQETIQFNLSRFVNALKYATEENDEEYSGLDFTCFKEISDYIENHVQEKFCLGELAKMANINKFGFSKKFKTTTGMTPMNYILMRKVFSSKKLIHSNTKLTDVAYQYHFTDMAHFSKTFKRFIGISPKKY